MRTVKFWSIALLASMMVLNSCKKDDDAPEEIPESTTDKNVMVQLVPTVNGLPLELGTVYTINGQDIDFDFFKLYLSDIKVLNDAGDVLADNGGNPVLGGTGVGGTVIGATSEEHFHMMSFSVGLDSLTNHQDPITADAPMNDPQMHWGWNPAGGYKFLRFEGNVDGSLFEAHSATDPLYRPGVMADLHSLSAEGDHIHIELRLELTELLDGISIEAGGNHGVTAFNTQVMDKLATGSPFSVH